MSASCFAYSFSMWSPFKSPLMLQMLSLSLSLGYRLTVTVQMHWKARELPACFCVVKEKVDRKCEERRRTLQAVSLFFFFSFYKQRYNSLLESLSGSTVPWFDLKETTSPPEQAKGGGRIISGGRKYQKSGCQGNIKKLGTGSSISVQLQWKWRTSVQKVWLFNMCCTLG